MTTPQRSWYRLAPLFAASIVAAVPSLLPATARADEATPPAGAETTTGSSGGSSEGSSGGSFRRSAGSFGAAGQWVFSISSGDEFPLRWSKTGEDDWNLVFRPSLDTFVVPNVSVGGVVTLSTNAGSSDVGIGARAGYNVALTSLVSIWIRGGLYYHHLTINNGPTINETVFDLNVPFLFHLVPHFFIGLGPFFHLPLAHTMDNTAATYGLTATVGGWL